MARAKGDYIAFIDAGMEINPNGISMLLEHMEWYDADIIVGSKRHPASKTNLTPLRKIYSWGYYLGVKFLFGLKVRDTQAGLKIFKRKVLEKVLPRLLVKEFAFDVELLAVAHHLGFRRIFEAPVELDLDFSDGSKFKKQYFPFFNKSIRGMLVDTIAIFYRLHVLRYYDDKSKRRWKYDKELDMRVNTGEVRYG
jgi:glycosyltransferase involved in cell wall biosynthesis